MAVGENARITVDGKDLEFPVVTGTEGEKGIDIQNLRAKTGVVTLDPAFMNTASTESAVTFLDGEKGILRYRGIPIEELGERSTRGAFWSKRGRTRAFPSCSPFRPTRGAS